MAILSKPRFRPRFRCVVVESVGVFLLSDKGHFLLRGEAIIKLAPFLNGRHTVEGILDALNNDLSPIQIFEVLDHLKESGHIINADVTCRSPEEEVFWDLLEIEHTTAAERIARTPISLVAFGNVDRTAFETALLSIGVQLDKYGEQFVVIADDYLSEELEQFNRERIQNGQSWLLLRPMGPQVWLGPAFYPGISACWECMAHRLRGHRSLECFLRERRASQKTYLTPSASLHVSIQSAIGLAATEAARWIVCGETSRLQDLVISFDTLELECIRHFVVRRPQCPQCGNPSHMGDRQRIPMTIDGQVKAIVSDGGYRTIDSEQTFKRLKHHISPITGIVGNLRQIDFDAKNNTDVVYSFIAHHAFVTVNQNLEALRQNLRGRSGGKGRTATQARTSALCEAIERYSGVYQGDEARILSNFAELGQKAIHPNSCMLFSERQLATWSSAGSNDPSYCRIPKPFDEAEPVEWSPTWSLTQGCSLYIPTAYCYYGYSEENGVNFAWADSNGCAAGNTKEEAILQGFLELVERDAVALWWYNRLKRPQVDLSSFGDPYFKDLVEFYRTRDRDLWVLDITTDLNIPAFVALSHRNDGPPERIILGFGAHLDAQLAISRALTEMNQSLPAANIVKADFAEQQESGKRRDIAWWQTAAVKFHDYLLPIKNISQKRRGDYPEIGGADLGQHIAACVEIASRRKLEVLVLDQTRADTNLNVVKVVVPGLRHFWPRFGPGRLYEVPKELGWLKRCLPERNLNPIPLYF